MLIFPAKGIDCALPALANEQDNSQEEAKDDALHSKATSTAKIARRKSMMVCYAFSANF